MSTRHEMFKARLRELGLYEAGDAVGAIGKAVEELSLVFANQGHSGMSASIVIGVFNQLIDEYNDSESPMWSTAKGVSDD